MANPAWFDKYYTIKPEVEKIFDDLDQYLDFCRFELREYNPAHLYDKNNDNYRAFLNSYRSSGKGERKAYQGKNPRNVQNISR